MPSVDRTDMVVAVLFLKPLFKEIFESHQHLSCPKPYSLGAAVLLFVAGTSGQYTFVAVASCAELDCGYPFSRYENESCIIENHDYRVNGMVPF